MKRIYHIEAWSSLNGWPERKFTVKSVENKGSHLEIYGVLFTGKSHPGCYNGHVCEKITFTDQP
jgi:hypothetical protein